MDSSDRTHRIGSTTSSTSSELFICFTSRLSSSSSSSMKISSKSSILSPGRARDPPISLSRRLRTSGSIKNGQASPMFPTGGRKRGCGFENPEPSSPKVTCIGQVRVKTKKQGKKMRTLSRRQSGEASFRKIEHPHGQIQRQTSINNQECLPHRNQRWVHFPLTICEALRGFGAEFSCLFPCRSSCFSTSEREKEEKAGREANNNDGQSSCGAVFARWLVAVQDGEGGKGREIELVVGGGDEEGERSLPVRSSRRHVFDEIEIKDEIFGVKDPQGNNMGGEEGRVSICIPPKNALLLMRCRSDPVKMEALANRFWEPSTPKDGEGDDDEREKDEDNGDDDRNEEESPKVEKDEVEMVQKEDLEVSEKRVSVSVDINEEQENHSEAEMNLEMEIQANEEEKPKEDLQINDELQDGEQEKQEETEGNKTLVEEENELSFVTALEALVDQESEEIDKNDLMEEKNEEESRVSYTFTSFPLQSSDEEINEPEEEEELAEEAALELDAMESTAEKEKEDKTLKVKVEEKVTQEEETQETHKEEEGEEGTRKAEDRETESNANVVVVVERDSDLELKKEETEKSVLPDCLLLMMCEPKLSMEVSKETWVCSTDFIRWHPEKKKPVQVKQTDGGDESNANTNSLPPHPVHHQPLKQPRRSSCSLPVTAAAVSMATMIEEKLVNAVAYEPFVLTRCKSEPMRTASKVAPDACFWKNRKLEPHRRATYGVGAAGVGC